MREERCWSRIARYMSPVTAGASAGCAWVMVGSGGVLVSGASPSAEVAAAAKLTTSVVVEAAVSGGLGSPKGLLAIGELRIADSIAVG